MADGDMVKFEGEMTFILFPQPPKVLGVDCDGFGITKWKVTKATKGDVEEGTTVSVKGKFPFTPFKKKKYFITGRESTDAKYGPFYSLMIINEDEEIPYSGEMKNYLHQILTEVQYDNMFATLSNPIQAIANHDIEQLMRVPGIGEVRAETVIEKYEQTKECRRLYEELADYSLSQKMIEKLLFKYKTCDRVIEVIKHNPYVLCEDVEGIGFKRADKYALEGGLSPQSTERVKALIERILREEGEEGNSYLELPTLEEKIYDYFGGCKSQILVEYKDADGVPTGETNITRAYDELSADPDSEIVIEDPEVRGKYRRRIYLKHYYNLEREIAKQLIRIKNNGNSTLPDDWKEKIKDLEEAKSWEFTDEQINGIKLGLEENICLISGLAGSGKSSLVEGILAALPPCLFAQCALSGKAAARLQEVTGEEGMTIHRLLGYSGDGTFTYDEHNPLPYDIIILDEISLVGGDIFLRLIKAIPNGAKLIMLGDMGQLESIGSLNLAYDLFNSEYIPTVNLTKIHRQAGKSGIKTTARSCRNQCQICANDFSGVIVNGEKQDMKLDLSQNGYFSLDKAMKYFKEVYNGELVNKNIMDVQLISPVKTRGNACVYNLNVEAQEICNPLKRGEAFLEIESRDLKGNSYKIHRGDKVMCIKNNYKALIADAKGKTNKDNTTPIFNGWVGQVLSVDKGSLIVDFPLAKCHIYMDKIDVRDCLVLGYASTVHKLQGSSNKAIIGVIDYDTPPSMLSCQLVYTLITRAEKYCVLVGDTRALCTAISNNAVAIKQTFLQEMLEELHKGE